LSACAGSAPLSIPCGSLTFEGLRDAAQAVPGSVESIPYRPPTFAGLRTQQTRYQLVDVDADSCWHHVSPLPMAV
ncbi:hypothetical protein CLOM_g7102, partial [Closterium sp. NIES-68]